MRLLCSRSRLSGVVLWLQVWDNNHHRDFHSRVNQPGKDQNTLEEEAYRQLLSNSLEADTEAAQRAGAPNCMPLPPTISSTF